MPKIAQLEVKSVMPDLTQIAEESPTERLYKRENKGSMRTIEMLNQPSEEAGSSSAFSRDTVSVTNLEALADKDKGVAKKEDNAD